MQGVAICLIVLFVAVCRVDARPRDHKRRHHGEADYKDEVNSCTFMVCPKGSQCTFNSSLSDPICVCITECKSHQHPVCGSDGLIYDNHCELHRAACIKQTHIAVVQDAVCKKPTSELIGSNLNVLSNQLDREDDAKQAQDITEPTVDVTADDNDDKDDEEYEPEEDKDEVRETEDEWDVGESDREMAKDEPLDATEKPIFEEIPTEVPCSEEGLVDLKTSILDHYRAQFSNSQDDPALPELDRKFLVSLMTNHFDSSRDSMLTKDEILSMVSRDRIGGLFKQCSLLDILRIYDKNGDKKLDPYEMYDAFDVHTVTIPEDIRQQTKVAKAGDNIVLVCGIDVEDKSNIIWQRNGMDLVDVELVDGIKTYDDGTLYFTKLTLMHMGTYTCYVEGYKSVQQTYTVEVQVPPSVHTCPNFRLQSLGKTAKVQCYAQGVPEPDKCWSQRGVTITERPGLTIEDGNTTVHVESLDYPDTGKYLCRASNPVGTVQAVSSVFIQENTKALDFGPVHVFYLFHSHGIRILEPDSCGFRLNIPPKHVLPKPHGLLCPPSPTGEIACSWGQAINVLNQFLYVTQPNNNRIIVVDIRTQLIIEVIQTNRVPFSLHYIPHLDTVWVVCWQSTDPNGGQRSVQVIKYVSHREMHTPIHTTPIGHHFDVVKGLYIPQVQIPNQGNYKFGYVVHSQQMAITKINLETTTLSSTIVLSQHQCYPDSVAFLSIGGYVIVSCADGGESQPSRQLFLDYLTDTVLHTNEGIQGTPYISPDGRYIISADNQHGLIYVQKVTLSGKVKSLFEVSTNLGVSDVGFFPTKASTHAYDIMVTSSDRPDVLFVDLQTSKVKMIPGVFDPINPDSWPWNEHNRHIVSSGVFGSHLATPSADHVVLIDGKKKSVHCNVDVSQSNVIVWVGDCY